MPPGPTLKQRLTALSLSQSSPSSPNRSNTYSSRTPFGNPGKRRPLLPFRPPWVKHNSQSTSASEGAYEEDGSGDGGFEDELVRDRTQEVMSRLIFQAGVDFETRPMVIISASALPDPKEVSYDVLLSRILGYLDLYVESDYTVVFFAAGGRYTPGWNWVWKAYRSLSRKYRKNLKRLIIVHSTFFSKMLVSLAGAIVSPKFFRKILYIQTLSELACHVPLTQIDIPPAVYSENLKHERSISMPIQTRANLFGVPLEELMGYDGEKGGVPRVVKDCIQFLRESGMDDEGLFRRSPSSTLLRQVQDAYDRGQTVSLSMFGDPHLAAVLLKKYLRDLPEPIFPERLYPIIRSCPAPSSDPNDISSIAYIRDTILPELTPCVYILLSNVLVLMHEVSLRSSTNRMDARNLAIVLCPNLLSGTNPARDVQMCSISTSRSVFGVNASEGKTTVGEVICICIERFFEVFDEVRDRSEAIAPEAASGASTSSQVELLSMSSSSSVNDNTGAVQPNREDDDDEEIDDAMLVMPLDPPVRQRGSPLGSPNFAGPSSYKSANGSNTLPYQPRTKKGTGNLSGVRSVHTTIGRNDPSGSSSYGGTMTIGKARSMISIEKGDGTQSRKGTITVGRGTGRKSTGAGVEALSVTAAGFFSPPSNAPPVPGIPSATTNGSTGISEDDSPSHSRDLSEVAE